LGAEIAKRFALLGWRLILLERSTSASRDGTERLIRVHGDITQWDTRRRLVTAADVWDVDVVVHNAGVRVAQSIETLTEDEIRLTLDVNLLAPMLLTRELWPVFARRRSGLIAFVNSLAGQRGGHHETAYSASKFGLRGFVSALRLEATGYGIHLLDVFVGALRTDMMAWRPDYHQLIDPAEAADQIVHACCLGVSPNRSSAVTELVIRRV